MYNEAQCTEFFCSTVQLMISLHCPAQQQAEPPAVLSLFKPLFQFLSLARPSGVDSFSAVPHASHSECAQEGTADVNQALESEV